MDRESIRAVPDVELRLNQSSSGESVRQAMGLPDESYRLSSDFSSLYDGGFHHGYWRAKYTRP
jgi:hypothetical protein